MAGNLSCFTQTPEKAVIRVPCGHIIMSSKWRSSLISSSVQGVKVIYEDNLGYIDFRPANHLGVIYAAEADLVTQASLRRKLAKLRKANQVQVIVMAEKTPQSAQYYPSLQTFVVLELGFSIITVPGPTEAAGVLVQMVITESKLESNPFRKKRRHGNLDEALLSTMQSIPKLGAVKASKLLEQFQSLSALNEASIDELSKVVGRASAQNIRAFLDLKTGT